MEEIIHYILSFLCGDENSQYVKWIKYCKPERISQDCRIAIIDSGFFDKGLYGTEKSLPRTPLAEIAGIPILFGSNEVISNNGKIIIHADIVASTYFLITRYEEMIRPGVRDQHGRFPGTASLPYRAGFINRPIVDEYGQLLRKLLKETGGNTAEPPKSIRKLWLTHDVDIPWEHFTVLGALKRVGGILKREHRFDLFPVLNLFGKVERDPLFTFKIIIETDNKVKEKYQEVCEVVYFIKTAGTKKPEDYVPYFDTPSCSKLLNVLSASGAILGVHFSYEAGIQPDKYRFERDKLKKKTGSMVTKSRNHYLSSREPSDMNALIDAGITDDFTMGYAEVAGFRLGTSRSVNWIDPQRCVVTDLILHPLMIMDGTLFEKQYMGLSGQDSFRYCRQIIDKVVTHHGELSLLWHNDYCGALHSINWENYIRITDYLVEIMKRGNSYEAADFDKN